MALAPLLRRHVLEPAWSRYAGAPVLSVTRELERSQYLPEPELRKRQMTRLRELLNFAYARNAFYRARLDRAGVAPDLVRSMVDVRRIPILTKADVRAHGTEMLSAGSDRP